MHSWPYSTPRLAATEELQVHTVHWHQHWRVNTSPRRRNTQAQLVHLTKSQHALFGCRSYDLKGANSHISEYYW